MPGIEELTAGGCVTADGIYHMRDPEGPRRNVGRNLTAADRVYGISEPPLTCRDWPVT